MAVYATVDDLEDELDGDPTPAHPERLLRRASLQVDGLLVGLVYDVDTVTGLPADSENAEKLKYATVLQAIYMAQTQDEWGVKGQLSSLSSGGVSWSRAGEQTAPRVGPAVQEYLRAVGLPGRMTLKAL